jgi:hypothetical protein
MGYEKDDQQPTLVMQIEPEAVDWPETRFIVEMLQLSEGRTRYTLVPQRLVAGKEQIGIETRSLLGAFSYLAEGVEVPGADLDRGVVTVTRDEAGNVFDWKRVTGDLLRIRFQPTRPAAARAAVRYRGHWFYIDDADLKSKSTFQLLSALFALQAGKIERVAPVYTLPLSR